jgi:hypothetical protein
MLGYPADIGFAIGFLRRIKEMAWVTFGLTGLTAHRIVRERTDAAVARTESAMQMQRAQGGESI